ncbi:MAG: hypothetical protein ACK4Z8_09315 [Novosphingobium sp.]
MRAKTRADRQQIIDSLQKNLRKGDKALLGNGAFKRFLRKANTGAAFEIDAGKLAEEACFDGISVVTTNADITALQAVIGYRELLQVESLFYKAKATFDTRLSRTVATVGNTFNGPSMRLCKIAGHYHM